MHSVVEQSAASESARSPKPQTISGDAPHIVKLGCMSQQGSDGSERRAGRRHKVNLRVNLTRGESAEVEGHVTNLSAGGCFVESDIAVSEDDLVKLRLNIPGRGDLTIWGNVVYNDKGKGFGLCFSAFSQGGARDMLVELVGEADEP